MIQIKELTQAQKDAIPSYRDKWIAIGLKTGETDWKTFERYIPICYKKAGIKFPGRVIRVSSPMVGAFAAAIAWAVINKWGKNSNAVRSAVDSAVGGAVRSAVGSVVSSAVGGAVDSEVDSAVGDAVGSAVGDAVGSAVDRAVDRAVRGAVDSAVDSAVGGTVGSAVGGTVGSAVGSAVDSAVGGTVGSAVSSAVDSAVSSAVSSAVDDAVDDAVGDAVGVAVRNAVDSAVGSAVRSAVGGTVGSVVSSAVGDAIKSLPNSLSKQKLNISWHYWLGGQFWVGGWYWGPSFSNFFFDICGLKLSKDIMERAEAYRKVYESVNYMWLNTEFVMVCARPVAIHRNLRGQLHNEHGMAIRYPDGWGLYLLNGVRFDEKLYLKIVSREMPMSEIMKITDIDQRVQAMRFAKDGLRDFYRSENGSMIDHYVKMDDEGRPINYELWRVKGKEVFRKEMHFAIYDCPSARERGEKKEYSKGVPACNKVSEAMAWGMSDENHKVTPKEWQEMIPLVHES